jgi:hypothetical protein
MKKDNYSKSLQNLVQELTNFQELLNTPCEPGVSESLKVRLLAQTMNSVQNIKTLAEEVKSIKSFTLLGQDFTHFCLLLVNGSDMADHLLALNETPAKIQKQVRSWKKIAAKFRPFLKNSIYSRVEAPVQIK